MFQEERESEIMTLIKEKGSASVKYLCDELFVSGATIRRDLIRMEKLGLIRRSHGGAVMPISSSDEPASILREQENVTAKRMIANIAVDFIKNNCCFFIDSSSTSGMVIPLLKRFSYLTIVTNGLKNALSLSETTNARIHMASGIIQSHSNSALGSDTVEYISNLHTDLAIVSCGGFELSMGITEAGIEQAKAKVAMVQNSDLVLLLIDSTKFGKKYMARSCSLKDIDYIITDKMPSQEYVEIIENSGCKLLTPDNV